MRKYDLVISLGVNCNCANNLKHYNLRRIGEKMPFDWIKSGTLASRVNLILNDFAGFLDPQNLRQLFGNVTRWEGKRYYNVVYDLVFAHDFPSDKNFHEGLTIATKNYSEKILNLQNALLAHKKILFVYMDNNLISRRMAAKKLRELRRKFGYNDIDFLIIENGVRTIWNLRKTRGGSGVYLVRTKTQLMPKHFNDTTPEMRKVLDKIFKPIERF